MGAIPLLVTNIMQGLQGTGSVFLESHYDYSGFSSEQAARLPRLELQINFSHLEYAHELQLGAIIDFTLAP